MTLYSLANLHASSYDYYSGGGEDDDKRVALGVNQTSAHSPQETYVCILCQEVSASDNQSTIVYSALVQKYVCPASLSSHYQQLNSPVTELSLTLLNFNFPQFKFTWFNFALHLC